MRFRRPWIVSLVLPLVAGWGATSLAAPACPPFSPTQVFVEPALAPIVFSNSQPSTALARMPNRAPMPGGIRGNTLLGISQAVYGESHRPLVRHQMQRDGFVCAAVERIDVSFGLRERNVFVARELPEGTCIHGEVLAHEMKHVAADEALLGRFVPQVKERLTQELARVTPVRARTSTQAVDALRRHVDRVMANLFREFGQERARVQAAIDTADEYRRVSRACGGELARYLPDRSPHM